MAKALQRVYCASPWRRASMWGTLKFPQINVVSTWHHREMLDTVSDATALPEVCRAHWMLDFAEIRQADHLLVYAEHKDRPNGTLVEVGYALGHDMPVHLVGNFLWGTWRYDPLVQHHATLREAVARISGVPIDATS